MRERYDAGGTQRTSSSILRGGAGLGVSVRGQRVRPSRIHPAFQCTHRRGRRREILDPCPAKLLHHRRRPRTQPARRPRRLPVKRKCRLTVDHREAVALERVLSACSSTDMVFAKGQPVPMPAKPEVRPPAAPGNTVDAPRLYDDNRNGRIPVGACHTVGRRADWTPIGALTSCFLLTHRGQHRALNNTDRRGNPLIWLDCGGQQSVLDNKPGCTRWRARSGSRHGRRERDLAGGVGAARSVSIAVSMTFPMRSAAASTSRSLTWA